VKNYDPNKLSPYVVVEAKPNRLHLQLNSFSRFIHLFTVSILPLCIVLLLVVSAYWLVKEDSMASVWPLFIVLPAPILMTMVPAFTDVIAKPGIIEVHYRKFFRTEVRRYQLSNKINLSARFRKAFRTAGWLFLLEDDRGNSTFLFSIPSLPYKTRTEEKDNLIQALQQHSMVESSDAF
jgi:hypothetical protein